MSCVLLNYLVIIQNTDSHNDFAIHSDKDVDLTRVYLPKCNDG